jgi:hypothetical protein
MTVVGTAPDLRAVDLADTTRAALEALRMPLLSEFLADWPSAPRERPVEPAALPVLRWLATIAAAAPLVAPELIAALLHVSPALAWQQTYTTDEMSAEFLDNYGWTEVLGLSGPRHSERLACGFLLLGPRTHYPSHQHAAEELYVPLSGRAEWRQGDGIWRRHEPGTVIQHRSEEPHAMRTQDQPLLAVYLWRGGDLAHKARLAEQ